MRDIRDYEAVTMLDLTDSEREFLGKCVDDLESGFAALEFVDTQGVEPLVTVLDTRNILREDVAMKLFTRDELLANAPEHYEGFYQVPGTFE